MARSFLDRDQRDQTLAGAGRLESWRITGGDRYVWEFDLDGDTEG
jgi:hypothetical protein